MTFSRHLSASCLLLAVIWLWQLPDATAREWTVRQGGLLKITVQPPAGANQLQVQAFGKSWPSDIQPDGRLLAWIGVDLRTKPGAYPLRWQTGDASSWFQEDRIIVLDGEFQKSYIKVAKKMAEFDAAAIARIRADQAAFRHAYQATVKASPAIVFAAMPVGGIISSPFGAQRFVNDQPRSPHSGIDIAVAEGTPITAPLAGRVLLAEAMFLNGNAIAIGHGRSLVTVYTHMQMLEVQKGQWVDTGEYIGKVGTTGRVTGAHLHWGVRFNGARINPLALIAEDKQELNP